MNHAVHGRRARQLLYGCCLFAFSWPAPARATEPLGPSDPSGAAQGERAADSRWRVNAFVRLRYRQSWVSLSPRLESLVEQQLPDPGVSAAALRTVSDTARASDGLSPTRAEVSLEFHASESLHAAARFDAARLLNAEEAGQSVRELAGVWLPASSVSLTAGIFALPFSLHELFEQQSFELTDEGPSHQLLEHLRYYGRDVGLMATLSPLPRREMLTVDIAAVDGGASGAQEYRGPGLFAARVGSRPIKQLELTSALSFRPRPLDAWWEELRYRYQAYDRGAAVALNAALLFERWNFRAEWLAGKRSDSDVRVPVALRRGNARAFTALWLMATARFPIGSTALVPAVRAEWLDSDRDHPDVGELIHLSFGVGLELSKHVRLTSELSRHLVQPGTRNWDFDVLRYQTDTTSGSLQLQLGI